MHRWANKKDMAGDDPPYLSVGTEVSAKYKGAFCEAKIRKVVKSVRCKVQYKNEQGSVFVNDEQIKGVLMPGTSVEVKLPEKKDYIEGTIVKIQDLSQYTVVFDDGDIATLRRTALCLKSGRHFAKSETLDQLPLTHPEHFSTPVVSGIRGSRRRDEIDDDCDDDLKREVKLEREEDMGKVVCVEIGDKKKSKDNWFPGLIVAPNVQDSVKIDVEEEYLIRSFKDGRYYTVPKRETVEFTREVGSKVDNPTLKLAVEKAISFLDKDDLPPHWDRELLFGMIEFSSETEDSDSDLTDDEPREEKDHFVAQLYKFMDDRGTPINKGPMICSKDVDLYRLFKIVNKLGGYNRVTNRNQWKNVALKLNYTSNQTSNVKTSYKKYLHSFEDFYRKLGCTMISHNSNNKLRSRSSRSLFRDREKEKDKPLTDKLMEKDENSQSDELMEMELQSSLKNNKLSTSNKEETDSDSLQKLNSNENSSDMKEEIFDKSKKNSVKVDNVSIKDCNQIPFPNLKEEKSSVVIEKKPLERKTVKSLSKFCGALNEKRADRSIIKAKNKNYKPIEKRIKKPENSLLQVRAKRSLKDRVKALLKKVKLKTGIGTSSSSNNEQDKKKQKLDEITKGGIPQLLKVKPKEDQCTGKNRKPSLCNNENKNASSGSGTNDKKSVGLTNIHSTSADTSSNASNLLSKFKKDDETIENTKKKNNSRKKKDEDKYLSNLSESSQNQAIEFVPPYKTICIGDKLKVYYEPTHESKVTYEAKVTAIKHDGVTKYLVHYTGWNNRYDEWIRHSRIADNLSWTPAREKKKVNQTETTQSTNQDIDQSAQPNQQVDASKGSSISPVTKNRSKNVVKSLTKQTKTITRNAKKLDAKSKKAFTSKDSESSSESDTENSQKTELQKTRSRTEKQKLEDSSNDKEKDIDNSKKLPTLKRTRSGSIKLENKVLKKRKYSPIIGDENNSKLSTNQNNLVAKSVVSRKRANNKNKEVIVKEETQQIESCKSDDLEDDENSENKENEENNDAIATEEKIDSQSCIAEEKNDNENNDQKNEEFTLILKLKPFDSEQTENVEQLIDQTNVIVPDDNANDNESTSTSTEDSGPPVLKKEVLTEDEMKNSRTTGMLLTDSYLSENLDAKPKIIKVKLKKDIDEKNNSNVKTLNCIGSNVVTTLSSSERLTPTKQCSSDVKEKTFFTSRASSAEKKMTDANDKDKKDVKLRTVNTVNSYLNIDKIDSIKRVSPLFEKSSTTPEKVTCGSGVSCKDDDDVYEFKEPEPFEFGGMEDRSMLHRRLVTRIFEDNNYKRPRPILSASDILREATDDSKFDDNVDSAKFKIESDDRVEDAEFNRIITALKIETNVTSSSTVTKSSLPSSMTKVSNLDKLPEVSDDEQKSNVPRSLKYQSSENMEDKKAEKKRDDYVFSGDDYEEDEDDENENEISDQENDDKLIISENDQSLADDDNDVIKNDRLSPKKEMKFSGENQTDLLLYIANCMKDKSEYSSDTDEDSLANRSDATPSFTAESQSCENETSNDKSSKQKIKIDMKNQLPNEKLNENRSNLNVEVIENDEGNFSSDNEDQTKSAIVTEKINKLDTNNAECYPYFPSSNFKSIPGVKSKHSVSKIDKNSSLKRKHDSDMTAVCEENVSSTNVSNEIAPSKVYVKDGVEHQSIIDEVEVEIFTATSAKKDSSVNCDKKRRWDDESIAEKSSKSKYEDEDDNDGLLLCEETIPKSPESKDNNHDVDTLFEVDSTVIASEHDQSAASADRNHTKLNTESKSATFISSTYSNPSPVSSEESTPGNSPSEERNGYSSTAFTINEKSSLNKDFSENETYSDNSEPSVKLKKYTEGNKTDYRKKNGYEFDSYLKKKCGKDSFYKDEAIKKKHRNYNSVSTNGSEKDDFSDDGTSSRESLSHKISKSSFFVELDPGLDGNQRIELMEQKLQELRKAYMSLKQELSLIDKRRKKLRRREREGRMMTRNEANSLL